MNIYDWLRNSAIRVRSDGLAGMKKSMYPVYKKGLHQVFRLSADGVPIYEKEWNLLIVLDACRVDLIKEVSPEFEYIDEVGSIRSVDTMTREWMKKNFRKKYSTEMSQTTFLCGNPHSERLLDNGDFQLLDETWRHGWNDDLGTLPPRPLTDRAIDVARSMSPQQMIVHYMQPHYPFITRPDLDNGIDIGRFGELPWDNVWERLRKGELDKNEVWEGYKQNLRYVLDDINLLLDNIDMERVIITSDHGNAIGEQGIYGHPIHMPIDELQVVPWIKTTATDNRTHKPDKAHKGDVDPDIEERLSQLGYYKN